GIHLQIRNDAIESRPACYYPKLPASSSENRKLPSSASFKGARQRRRRDGRHRREQGTLPISARRRWRNARNCSSRYANGHQPAIRPWWVLVSKPSFLTIVIRSASFSTPPTNG